MEGDAAHPSRALGGLEYAHGASTAAGDACTLADRAASASGVPRSAGAPSRMREIVSRIDAVAGGS